MSRPTHFPNGFTNVRHQGGVFHGFPFPDPSKIYGQFEDFITHVSDFWITTIVELGSGSASVNPSDEKGGVLVLTNDDADNDSIFLQWEGREGTTNSVSEQVQFEAGHRFVFKTRFKLSNATQTDFIAGVYITDTTPLATSDGVYFIKNDDVATVDFVIIKDSVATTTSAIATLTNDTYIELGYFYTGKGTIEVYVNDLKVATVTDLTNMPTRTLALGFGVQNGSAGAKTASMDYIGYFGER